MSACIRIEQVATAMYEMLAHAHGTRVNGEKNFHNPNALNLVGPFEDHDIGIHVCFSIDIEQYGYEKDGNTHHPEWQGRSQKCVHYIMLRYHRIFMAVVDTYDPTKVELKDWINTSNHDSCWRSDGVQREARKAFIEAHETAYANTPDENTPPPILSSDCAEIGLRWHGNTPFEYVRVKHEAIDQKNTYHRKLTEITKLRIKSIELEEAE